MSSFDLPHLCRDETEQCCSGQEIGYQIARYRMTPITCKAIVLWNKDIEELQLA